MKRILSVCMSMALVATNIIPVSANETSEMSTTIDSTEPIVAMEATDNNEPSSLDDEIDSERETDVDNLSEGSFDSDNFELSENNSEENIEMMEDSSQSKNNSGFWGDVPYEWDDSKTIITLGKGTAGPNETAPWKNGNSLNSTIRKIVFTDKVILPRDTGSSLFSALLVANFEGLENLDTSLVEDMSNMFMMCSTVESLDLSSWDTSSVKNMSNMFNHCPKLKELSISTWDVSKVTTLHQFLLNCTSLKSVDMSGWDMSSVTNMDLMLFNCTSLTNIDVSGWDMSSVTNMANVFGSCTGLTNIDVSGWDTSSVTNMNGLFDSCTSLTNIDVSGWDTSSVNEMANVFGSCTSLTNIDVSGWDTSSVTNGLNTFRNTSSLQSITLGPLFRFSIHSNLGSPAAMNGPITGKWTKADGQSQAYTASEFMQNYGTGDLTAGTYVGELSIAELESDVRFDKNIGIVGGTFQAVWEIRPTESSPINAIAKDISVNINRFFECEFEQEVLVQTYDKATNEILSTEEKLISSESITLPDLPMDKYYKIIFSGGIWNTSERNDEGNYDLETKYRGYSSTELITIHSTGFFEIQSGMFGISNIPSELLFETMLFEPPLKDIISKRKDSSWAVEVSDYRGTVGIEEGAAGDRTDWEMVVTATPFVGSRGKTVNQDVMAIIYSEDGNVTDVSSTAETLISSHSTLEETPKTSHLHKISWEEEDGFAVKIYDTVGIDPGETYHSEMTFELRSAP